MRGFAFWAILGGGLGCVAGPCAAQAFYYLPPPTVSVSLPTGACYVAHVVDARPQRASLGLVTRAGAPQLATFRDGLVATLTPFFARYAYAPAGSVPLVMRVVGLEIAETPGSLTETATAGLVADFYAPQPDSSYRLVAHFAQTREQSGFDVTGQHAANLGHLLLAAAALGRTQATWLTNTPRRPLAQLLGPRPLPGETLPILDLAGQPRPGFYYSLTEFWQNQPGEPGPPVVESHPYSSAQWSGDYEVKPYHIDQNGHRTLATDVWGFCDGENFYIRRGHSFYKLQRQGTGFTYFGEIGDDPAFQRAANGQAVAAGIAGGLLLAGATAPSGARRVSFMLDVLTGKSNLTQAGTAVANRPTHLFIYRPRDAKGPAVRIRLAEGEPAKELAAGDFLTFEPACDQPLQVCLVPATGPETRLTITPTAEAPTYLECRPTTAVPLHQVKDATGAAAVSRLVR